MRRLHVAFVHPDLGLGGAERLVIDAACGLDSLGHHCTIYTAHLDATRAFHEVTSSAVRARAVRVPAPRAVFGRLHALLAAVRCALVALYVCLFARPDVAIVDIVTLPALVFSAFGVPVLFYCHYPDKLLARALRGAQRGAALKAYRAVVDWLEASALTAAHAVAVNSGYTAAAYVAAFPRARPPTVVHPCAPRVEEVGEERRGFVLSLNRYERKKNVELVIKAVANMKSDARLVIAGGWDARIRENREYQEELEALAKSLGVRSRVRFVRNVSAAERARLLRRAAVVAYTPAGEHFGIVPLEAMAAGTPVVAVDDAGPRETVRSGVTGVLCAGNAEEFAIALDRILGDKELAKRMGAQGRIWVRENFSREAMAAKFDTLIQAIA